MRLFFTTISILILCAAAWGQESRVSPDQAQDFFESENYARALPMYEQLIKRYDKEPKYNYYYGVCLVEQRQNNSEAIRRLEFAASKRVTRDVHFYLGRAYQNAYQYEEAAKEFNEFLEKANTFDLRKAKAERALKNCSSGEKLINKYFDIKVTGKDTINENAFLSAYNLPEDAGTLAHNKSFFKTGVPPENIMYRTEKGDEVYFVMQHSDTSTHDIYKMERLLDKWSSSKNLREPVNSDYDDRYPFLMVDGSTFFFASDRPGGMGGMDIYRSVYDPESNTFSEPENLGPPFNSPADDYLFAADPFGEKAWFTTNRGIKPGQVVVAEIIWDNNVIKNLTDSIEQIQKISKLPVTGKGMWKSEKEKQSDEAPEASSSNIEQFRFHINDTIVYTRYDHFLSDAARAEFKRGQSIDMKKDSLEQLMRNKRQQYAQSYKQEELNRLMEEILKLEETVYGHDDQMKRHYNRARQLETERIINQIEQGNYQGTRQNNPNSIKEIPAISLRPENFTFYTDEEFHARREKLSGMYDKYFNPAQRKSLQQTDSMYTWANILKLEASKLLEQPLESNEPGKNKSLIQRVRNIDSLIGQEEKEEEQETEQQSGNSGNLYKKAKEIQKQALDMYHNALDRKYNIYRPTLQQLAVKSERINNVDRKANSYFEEANNGLKRMQTWNPEKYEQLGAVKRQAIEMIESELLAYKGKNSSSLSENKSQTDTTGKIQKNYQKIQANRDKSERNSETRHGRPDTLVKSAFGNSTNEKEKQTQLLYKIQIGVFRNAPDNNALTALPKVSSKKIQGKELTKYFAGKWSSYDEAQKQLPQIKSKGFPDAYVVAFFDGEQIPISKARSKEQ